METGSFPHGVRRTRNPLGGHAVEWDGKFIGWLHASFGDKWNAYVRGAKPGVTGLPLGRFAKDEAVRRIAIEAGWPGSE